MSEGSVGCRSHQPELVRSGRRSRRGWARSQRAGWRRPTRASSYRCCPTESRSTNRIADAVRTVAGLQSGHRPVPALAASPTKATSSDPTATRIEAPTRIAPHRFPRSPAAPLSRDPSVACRTSPLPPSDTVRWSSALWLLVGHIPGSGRQPETSKWRAGGSRLPVVSRVPSHRATCAAGLLPVRLSHRKRWDYCLRHDRTSRRADVSRPALCGRQRRPMPGPRYEDAVVQTTVQCDGPDDSVGHSPHRTGAGDPRPSGQVLAMSAAGAV